MIYVLSASMAFNLSSIVYIYLQYRKLKLVKARPESVELKEFLFDLLSGDGLIQVKRIATSDVVLRSPRGRS